MGRGDVAQALRRLDDDAVRARVAGGGVDDFRDLHLDDDEQMLVADAARDYPEVLGFAFDVLGQQLEAFREVEMPGTDVDRNIARTDYLRAYTYAMGDGSV